MSYAEFIEGAARAFFVSWYADEVEQDRIPVNHGFGVEWMDVAPATPAWAYADAAKLLDALPGPFNNLMASWEAIWTGDRPWSPNLCGHYAAMGAMGHGVSLNDFGINALSVYIDPSGHLEGFGLEAALDDDTNAFVLLDDGVVTVRVFTLDPEGGLDIIAKRDWTAAELAQATLDSKES